LRVILHKDGEVWSLLYADHHDDAYAWAERRRAGRHPRTGGLQVVEIVETVLEVQATLPTPEPAAPAQVVHTPEPAAASPEPAVEPLRFETHDDDYLLSLGVPEDWLSPVRHIRTDEQLFVVIERLPQDVAERLLDLAAGETVEPPTPITPDQPVTASADTQRSFFVPEDEAALRVALAAPFDRWISFLHPTQRKLVEKEHRGPAKVSGSAGTGKTVVALHRARRLARQGKRVLLTSYVGTLCENLERNLAKLCSPEERERVTVSTVHKLALTLVQQVERRARPARDTRIEGALERLLLVHAADFDRAFVLAEWHAVVEAQGIDTWTAYRRARRVGRGTGLSVRDRKRLWKVFGGVQESLAADHRFTFSGLCNRARALLAEERLSSPFDAVIVDEVQDLRAPELRLLRDLCAASPGGLLLVGDAGQRIFAGGFSLSRLGIEVRGRSRVLRLNYRTTEQIRRSADLLVGASVDDLDGGTEGRSRTRSLVTGPAPLLQGFASQAEEDSAAVRRVDAWLDAGIAPEAIAIFARSASRLERVGRALEADGMPTIRLRIDDEPNPERLRLGTMHRAKGLEFRAVLLIGCNADLLPHPLALRDAVDPKDREDAEAQERRLLYVAMTRARDELAVTWARTPSPFLAPLIAGDTP